MPHTEANLEQLDILATEISERFRRGEHPSVAEYVAKYPHLVDDLRALFPTIAAMERLKNRHEFRTGSRASLRGLQLSRLGDFRIIREIGRGGMGIVYEAEQESLARRVAVKVLPRHVLLAPEHLQRFQREAQIAGRLHHTNIVSVFGVGEHDGFHYYVMPIIPGVGLDRVIARLAETNSKLSLASASADTKTVKPGSGTVLSTPALDDVVRSLFSESEIQTSSSLLPTAVYTPGSDVQALSVTSIATANEPPALMDLANVSHWNRIARIGWQVANALDFAHRQGTLHCDIKPANLLVDPQGTVWVTDFGVAKAMQADKLTRTGDVTGTLHYTAPERFRGITDARSDIYSLGLTLYELLALRPAFDHNDRQAVMRQILEGVPPPLRQRVPHVPRDLETIVLKAIARDPQHRYATASALAADLQCFLEDRPILARRATPHERVVRWCRKNPVVASLLGTVALLLVTVVFLITRGYLETRELQQAERRQRHKAEATTRVALDVLDRIYAQFAPHGSGNGSEFALASTEGADGTEVSLPVRPAISPETAMVLDNLLAFYDRLAINSGDNLELRQEAAKANRRVADIQAQLGQQDKARSAYQKALKLYQMLALESGAADRYAAEIAGIHNELSGLDRSGAQDKAAKLASHEALKILEPVAEQASASAEARFELARTYYNLGTAARGSSVPAGRNLMDDSLERPPGPPGPHGRREPPGGHEPFGKREPLGGRESADGREPKGPLGPPADRFGHPPRREEGHFDRGNPPPRPEGPDGPGGHPHDEFGPPPPRESERPPEGGNDPHEDDRYLLKAIALLKQLCTENPKDADYQHLLACSYRELARSPVPPPEASNGFDQATALLEKLVHDYPHVPEYRFDLIATQARLGVRDPQDRTSQSDTERDLRRALQSAKDLVSDYPDVPAYAAFQVPMLQKLATLLRRAQRFDEAQAELQQAIKIQADLVARFPDVSTHRLWLAMIRRSAAEVAHAQGKLADARSLLEGARDILSPWPDSLPSLPQTREILGDTYFRLSKLLTQLGDKSSAAEAQRHGQELLPPR